MGMRLRRIPIFSFLFLPQQVIPSEAQRNEESAENEATAVFSVAERGIR